MNCVTKYRHLFGYLALSLALLGNPLLAQEKPAEPDVNQQLSQLESELGKYKDASPEAAALMLKLADQYYQHGRALGLVRICQRFTTIQIKHAQHQQMMFKLIDGLQVLSRNKDMIVACRQYLERYGKSAQANSVEVRLADALMQTPDREGAAVAAHAVWKRNANNPIGKKYAAMAVARYQALGGQYQKQGGELSEDVFNRMPTGTFAQFMGENAAKLYATIELRVESNRVIAKLFQRGMAGDANSQRQWHLLTAQNYEKLQQYTNAAAAYQRVRQIRDEANLLYSQVMNVYNSQANPAQTEGLMNQFKSKYPTDARKWTLQLYVANQYLGAKNKPKGLALIRDALQGDAVTFDAAGIFLRENGSELPRLQDTERVFRAALSKQKHPPSRARLYRYLAFSIYTGEAANKNRSLALCREFLSRWAENSSDTQTMISYLFANSPDDNTFRNDVKMVLAARKKTLQYANLLNYPKAWLTANKSNKELKTRTAILKQELDAADRDPLLKLWITSSGTTKKSAEIRDQLLQPNYFNAMNNEMATRLLYQQTDYYRRYAPTAKRGEGTKFYAQWVRKYPTDEKVARDYVAFATDYGTPEDCRAAMQHMLRFQWKTSDPDLHRRMMICAGRNKDVNLARQAYSWIKREEQKHGYVANNTVQHGDVLQELKLANEARERFTIAANAKVFTVGSRDGVMRLLDLEMDRAKKIQLLQQAITKKSDYYGYLIQQLAAIYLAPEEGKKIDWNGLLTLLEQEQKRRVERPFRTSGLDPYAVVAYMTPLRADEEMPPAQKTQFLQRFARLDLELASSVAQMFLSDAADPAASPLTQQLLVYQATTIKSGETYRGFDQLTQFVRAAAANQRHVVATTVGTGILENFSGVDEGRRKAVRDLVSKSYTQIGEVGLTIDEDSPIAPLLQAALYLRLGDQELAFELYTKNKALFDEHRQLMPVDLVEFVVGRLIAAGGDENFNYVEDLVRTWIVKNTESEEVGLEAKATMQLLLARNYFKARRFDIARSEFTTVVNRYPDTTQSVEAQFGIGESFMEQKVFDQAAQVFDKLANSTETLIVVRAEFLRGVLSFRRGDRDEARGIFRSVLERVPDVELANQTLYNLAEVYRVEERYIDQLNLLRTIGRLGRRSKNRHAPGMPLSIVVHDSDLGISRGQSRIPVIVTTEPGKDREMVYLVSTGAGKGLFRTDLETTLGEVTAGDGRLQLTGKDVIRCDYPDEFKKEFKSVPLSDVDIRVAANADFEIASSTLDGDEEISFSQALAEQEKETGDARLSQARPSNQVKPGNPLYIRVDDTDRDLGPELDKLVVKMVTDSGDEVQVNITETAPHSGIFEGQVKTAELPAGALATDSAINHSPLMAIDKDPKTFWSSQPDGAAPKALTVDMKDLYSISRVSIATPSLETNTPVRMDLLGSYDGEFWFRLSSFPQRATVAPVTKEISGIQQTIVMGNHLSYRDWNQVVGLAGVSDAKTSTVESELLFSEEIPEDEKAVARSIIWNGLLNIEKTGAVRFRVRGNTTGLVVNGVLELAVAPGSRTVDVWMEKGHHEITAFSAFGNQQQGAALDYAMASVDTQRVILQPLRAEQFVAAKPTEVEILTTPKVIKRIDVKAAQLTKKTETFALVEKAEAMVTQNWNTVEDLLTLNMDGTPPGVYELWLEYSRSGTGNVVNIDFGNQSLVHPVMNTASWDTYRTFFAGNLMVEASGQKNLVFTPTTVSSNLMELKAVELRPVERDAVVKNGDAWEFRFPHRELRYTRVVVNEYVGDAVAINHVEVGDAATGKDQIPTDADILSLASNQTLEIAAGDRVVATYTDEFTQNDLNTSQLLTHELTATYNNADINAISYTLSQAGRGGVSTQRKELMRVDPGERIVVEVVDFDEDKTNKIDKVMVEVVVNDGEPIQMEATETDPNSGIFTREIDTTAGKEEGQLTVKQGDVVYLRYNDTQNTFPGHTVPRERAVFVNEPTDGTIRIIPSLARRSTDQGNVSAVYLSDTERAESSAVAFAVPLLVEVIDPDRAKDSASKINVALQTTGGSTVVVECVVSNAHSDLPQSVTDNQALLAGRFVGQVIMQLGSKDSPAIIPLTGEMPRGLIGRVHDGAEDAEPLPGLVAMVLNLTGQDTITAQYRDEVNLSGKRALRNHAGKLVATGQLQVTDREYEESLEQLHVGEKLFLKVNDPDQDISNDRDRIQVTISTELGEKETVELFETTVHSGEFTAAFALRAKATPTAGNLDAKDPFIESYFGDIVTATYTDTRSADSTEPIDLQQEVPVVVGTNGLVTAFTKAFNDEGLAVETKFRIAESYFELFKSHKQLERNDEQTADLEAGRRILNEVIEDYPDPRYVPRISYLLGQFSQELEQWKQAIASYEIILQQYGDHTLAADAQYKMAQCYEKAGDFDEALEAYVTLAATYPKSPLISSVMIRISDHFYKSEDFQVAAQVGEKFLERFDGHEAGARMAFRVGQCYYKSEQYREAGTAFDRFAKLFPEDPLGADAMFWSGESYRMGKNNLFAFRRYYRCHSDFPSSDAAKYARGRLAEPDMLNQFEAEANSIDNEN